MCLCCCCCVGVGGGFFCSCYFALGFKHLVLLLELLFFSCILLVEVSVTSMWASVVVKLSV